MAVLETTAECESPQLKQPPAKRPVERCDPQNDVGQFNGAKEDLEEDRSTGQTLSGQEGVSESGLIAEVGGRIKYQGSIGKWR
jgi:hypothetical protein